MELRDSTTGETDMTNATTFLNGISEAIEIDVDAIVMRPNDNECGVITHADGTQNLVCIYGTDWVTIPGYFGEDA
jgi:hypothetical protein